MYDVIIIGGGVAGMTAGIYAVRGGHKVLLFEGKTIGGQITLASEVENYPGLKSVSGFELAMNMQSQAESLGVEFVYDEVKELDFQKMTVNEKMAGNIVLAMGQSPKSLGLEDEGKYIGRGISYCAMCDGMFYKNKTVAVVGGGNTAVGDCLYLSRVCKKVYLIHRRNEFRADKLELDKIKGLGNVELLTPYVPEKILGADRVQGLVLSGGKEIVVDGIFLAIGYQPNTQLVKDKIVLSESGYILTDEKMRTNIKNVYACGDIVEKPLRQLVTACSDGAIAVSNLE